MSTTAQSNAAAKREAWARLRELPSGRWQVRYPGPDGTTYTARTDQDRPFTFLTKTDARTWLAGVQSKMARGLWVPPEETTARLQAEQAIEQAQSLGFEEYSARWLEMIRTEPNRSGKKRALGTVRAYKGKVTGYLIPEFGDTPVREIDAARIKVMTDRLDQIPAPLNPDSKFNGITRPGLIVLMMILRQAARDGIIPAAPNGSVPRQESVRHDADHDAGEDVANPIQVEALYEAIPDRWAIAVLLAAWCQLRRGECLGLQRRDIEWHDDGSATLHVRRQLNANTGGYTELKSEAGRRSLSIPKLMIGRLQQHLEDNVAPCAKPLATCWTARPSASRSRTLRRTCSGYRLVMGPPPVAPLLQFQPTDSETSSAHQHYPIFQNRRRVRSCGVTVELTVLLRQVGGQCVRRAESGPLYRPSSRLLEIETRRP